MKLISMSKMNHLKKGQLACRVQNNAEKVARMLSSKVCENYFEMLAFLCKQSGSYDVEKGNFGKNSYDEMKLNKQLVKKNNFDSFFLITITTIK